MRRPSILAVGCCCLAGTGTLVAGRSAAARGHSPPAGFIYRGLLHRLTRNLAEARPPLVSPSSSPSPALPLTPMTVSIQAAVAGAMDQPIPPDEPPATPTDNFVHQSNSHVINKSYGPYWKVGKFSINPFGIYFAFMSLFFGMLWGLGLLTMNLFSGILTKLDPHLRYYDHTSRWWSWMVVVFSNSYPTITGLENMVKGPAVYVANHASWMDVPYASLLPHESKYFAKAELTKVPILGHAMKLAGHVILDREDKRAQMQAFMRSLEVVRSGQSLLVFPEGTRGKGGRLSRFKSGAFKIALKAGIPVVPISMAGTQILMPPEVLMPQRPGRGITAIHVHPPLYPEPGMTDRDLAKKTFDIINNALPPEQQHPKLSTSEDVVEG